MITETVTPARPRTRAKAEPTAAEWLERIQAAEKALTDARTERAAARTQLEWLQAEKERVEHLMEQRRLFVEGEPCSCAETVAFWERNSSAGLAERLRRVVEGGVLFPVHGSAAYQGEHGETIYAAVVREISLPPIEEAAARVVELEAQVAAAEVALREAKRDGYAALAADYQQKQAAFEAVRADVQSMRGDLSACQDIDAAMALRAKLDQSPLRLVAAERAAVAAKAALTNLGDPATEGEIADADAAIVARDAAFKTAAADLQAAKMARLALTDRSQDMRAEKIALKNRLAELDEAWRQLLASKDMRSLV